MKNLILLFSFLTSCSFMWAMESISSKDAAYRDVCSKAVADDWYFKRFRSMPEYTHIVEAGGDGHGFAKYLKRNASHEVVEKFKEFESLDSIGQPKTQVYPGIGTFSSTTLRYIIVADQIKSLFSLPSEATVVEIGAGFGGQCFILSHLQSFSNYYIFDLPEVEALIQKVLGQLNMDRVHCLPFDHSIPEETIDLVISNYAFSECDRQTQMDYFEKVIKKSNRGYVIYNQIARRQFGLDYLSPKEFISLLNQNGMHPRKLVEPVVTSRDNILIVWDKTR